MSEKNKNILLWVITCSIIVFGIGGLLVFSYFYSNQCYTAYEVISETPRSDSNNGSYQYFQKNLLKYSGNGISLIDYRGKNIWNAGFEMKQVQVDTCAESVIAADIGGNTFCVYNGRDEGVSMETTYPIERARVSEQGLAAVLEQDTDSDNLKVYNPRANSKKLLVEIPTNVTDEGYPLDYDISPDGTSLVAAYMTTTGTEAKCRLNFYNFSDVGQDKNILVGGREYDDIMIAGISFTDNDHVIIYRENGFDVFSNMKEPVQILEMDFDGVIMSIADSPDYIGVITGDVSMENKRLHVYNMKGKEILNIPVSYEYSVFRIYGDEFFFYGAHHLDIVRMNGRPKFSCDFDIELDGVFPSGRSTDYIILDYNSIKRIRIKAG